MINDLRRHLGGAGTRASGLRALRATSLALAVLPPVAARLRSVWWRSFLVVSLLALCWGLASPLFAAPDEPAHTIYAAAAVRGEFLEETEGAFTTVSVPGIFGSAHKVPMCYVFKPETPAGCALGFEGSTETTRVGTYVGRYPPAYYLAAGLPIRAFPSARGVYLARLVTILISSALLASAFASAATWQRSRLLVTGVAVAVTPMVLFLSGVVNPQAVEIAAATCVWVSGLVLLGSGPRDGSLPVGAERRLIARLGISAVLLCLSRPMSPLWLVIIGAAVLAAVSSRARVRELLGRWDARICLALVVVAGAGAAGWTVVANALVVIGDDRYASITGGEALKRSVEKLDYELQQMVGVFGWLDTPSPGLTYLVWYGCLGLLVLLGLAAGRARLVVTLVAVGVACAALPVALEISQVHRYGFPWQGRYTLPIAVGVPLLAAYGLGLAPRVLAPRAERRLAVTVAAAVGVAHVVAFVGALHRYLHGVSGGWRLDEARWDPPVAVVPLLGMFLVGVVLWVILLVRTGR